MSDDDFWALIELISNDHEEPDLSGLIEALEKCSNEELIGFQERFEFHHRRSYNWNLWGAAYLINGGCSDDGFDYFRAWLITQGKDVFSAGLADPDSLVDHANDEFSECEEILVLACRIYRERTDDNMPLTRCELPELGESWDFDDDVEMKKRYPRLFARFCE